jgi:phosphomannomutase
VDITYYTTASCNAYNEEREVTVLITFGESGWFGIISDGIGFETVSIVAQAVADYLNDTSHPGMVVLGYDTRFLSREYAWAIQRVLTANRIQVFLHKKPIPTAFLSMSVKIHHADLGLMVTGESRPARYSGISFRLPPGKPADRNWLDTLFQYLYRRYPRSSDDTKHLLNYIDVFPDYIERIEKIIDIKLLSNRDPFIVSDSFFGSVGTYFQDMLKKWSINGIHIRTKPNPGFMDCVPFPNNRNMHPISRLASQKRGDAGFFFNADGSTLGLVSSDGKLISSMEASALMLDEWYQAKGKNFDVYTELFTPNRVHDLLSGYGIKALPLHSLQENNKNWDRAIIWDRNGLTFGPFLPDQDGMMQSLLLIQALSRNSLDWGKITEKMKELTGECVLDQRTLHLDSSIWDKKQKTLLTWAEKLASGKLVEWLEVGECKKLCFQDGSWLGLSYNSAQSQYVPHLALTEMPSLALHLSIQDTV